MSGTSVRYVFSRWGPRSLAVERRFPGGHFVEEHIILEVDLFHREEASYILELLYRLNCDLENLLERALKEQRNEQ
jgi:hypothetical protein